MNTILSESVTLTAEDDPSVYIELIDYSLKFDSNVWYERFIDGDIDVENQHQKQLILLSGSGRSVDKLNGYQNKIFVLRIGLTNIYRCTLMRIQQEITDVKHQWSMTLETIPADTKVSKYV